jgi:hypothetical protein
MWRFRVGPFAIALQLASIVACGGRARSDVAAHSPRADDVVASVQISKVDVPVSFNVPYAGAAKQEFAQGLPLSIGSGLRLKPRAGSRCRSEHEAHSGYSLLALSDRGPNADAPKVFEEGGVNRGSKSFLAVDFAPQLVTIDVNPQSGARVRTLVPLRSGDARAVGLPPASLTTELALSESLSILPASSAGIDPEGLDFDAQGNVWLCEEYGPSLLQVSPETGEIVARFTPGSGLPRVLANRQVNRGCEGVAVTPSGKVYGILQSTMDVAGQTKENAQFIRVFEFDPTTRKTRLFGYPPDVSAYKTSADAKMGDLIALDDSRFLTIEEGKDKHGKLRNIVYEFDLSGASDLSGVLLTSGPNSGKELEFATSEELAAQVRLAAKTRVLDLRAYGYTAEKAEGLALLDERTLVVINDNDFGVGGVIEGDASGGTDPGKYVVTRDGALTFHGAPSPGSYAIHAFSSAAQETALFIVQLRRAFVGYCARR